MTPRDHAKPAQHPALFAGISLAVALYRPQIPPNTGNIARLCAATGTALWIIGEPNFAMDDKAVKRAGLDYWPSVKLFRAPTLDDFVAACDRDGRDLWVVETTGGVPFFQPRYTARSAFLFGNETDGLPLDFVARFNAAHPDRAVYLPMTEAVRSINLSTTVGIVTYHALAQLWG
jgi:tRNA (cytidine/uridine-2'-O-)-methyltransferase